MNKTLNKSSSSNQLGTYFELYASCGCGICGCPTCTDQSSAVSVGNTRITTEAGYRNALANAWS